MMFPWTKRWFGNEIDSTENRRGKSKIDGLFCKVCFPALSGEALGKRALVYSLAMRLRRPEQAIHKASSICKRATFAGAVSAQGWRALGWGLLKGKGERAARRVAGLRITYRDLGLRLREQPLRGMNHPRMTPAGFDFFPWVGPQNSGRSVGGAPTYSYEPEYFAAMLTIVVLAAFISAWSLHDENSALAAKWTWLRSAWSIRFQDAHD